MIGVVLSGGRSQRMGTDKALLPFKDGLLIHPSIKALQTVIGEVIISSNKALAEKLQFQFPTVTVSVDQENDMGPLGGIATVLSRFNEDVVCLPADAPNVSESLVTSMIEQYIPPVSAIKHLDTGHWDGLFSIWNPLVLPELELYLQSGARSVKGFLNQMDAQPIYWTSRKELKNVNTPEDLDQLE